MDANHKIGIAHVVRSSYLVAALERDDQVFVLGDEKKILEQYFPEATIVDKDFDWLSNMRPVAIIVDLPFRPDQQFLDKIVFTGTPFILVDDYGGELCPNLVINGTVIEDYHRYPNIVSDHKKKCGPEYALISPHFCENHWMGVASQKTLTIVIGSGKRAYDWARMLIQGDLKIDQFGTVNFIVGASFPQLEFFTEESKKRGLNIQSNISSKKMAELLAHSAILISTGGMIVYEALAVGVPTIVFPQERNLVREATWLEDRRCIINLGFDEGMVINKINKSLEDILNSKEKAVSLSQNARLVVDGLGIKRAAGEINKLLNN